MKRQVVLVFFVFALVCYSGFCFERDRSVDLPKATSYLPDDWDEVAVLKRISEAYKKHSQMSQVFRTSYDPLLTVVLMVKNEESVIRETLQPFIDALADESVDKNSLAFFLFDTGSTDNTMAVTKKFFEDNNVRNFAMQQEPFIDFSASRNRGLQLAKEAFPHGCFLLMPDAEWYMNNVKGLVQFCDAHKNDIHNSYLVRIRNPWVDFYTARLIRCRSDVGFEGVVHEALNEITLEKVSHDSFFEWSPTRCGVEKSRARWVRDCQVLLKEYERDPQNTRTVFYIAQTYDCLDDLENARLWYTRRIAMPGWDEENFLAQYRLADVYERLGSWEAALSHYITAWSIRPTRAEPLVRCAQHYWKTGENEVCFLFARQAAEVEYPQGDRMHIEKYLYDYDRYDLLGISAWYVGQYELGKKAVLKALEHKPDAPHLHENLKWYASKLS